MKKFWKEFKPALIEGLKELLRVIMLAVIPVAISSLENNGSVDIKTILLVAGVAFLRFLDKVMHEWGKILDDEMVIKGITRF